MTYFFWRMAVQVETPLRQDSVVDMVTNSGLVVQSVLYLLMSFSVISWGVVHYKFRQIRQARSESERFTVVFWETKNLSAIHTASLEMQASPVAQVFRAGYQELMRLTRLRKQPNPGEGEVSTTEEGGIENV